MSNQLSRFRASKQSHKIEKSNIKMRLLFKSALLIAYMQASIAFSIPKPSIQFRTVTTKENAQIRECIGDEVCSNEVKPVMKHLLHPSFFSNSSNPFGTVSFDIRAFLDFNDDGKIDTEDVKIMFHPLTKMLDVNCTGNVDVGDSKAIISVLLLVSALLLNPVAAGALGLGGGGSFRGGSFGGGSFGGGSVADPGMPLFEDVYKVDYTMSNANKYAKNEGQSKVYSTLPGDNDMFYPKLNTPKPVHANRDKDTGGFQARALSTNIEEEISTAVRSDAKYTPITIWPVIYTIFGMYMLAREETIMILQKIQNTLTDDPIDYTRSGFYRGFSSENVHGKTIKQRVRLNFTQNGYISGSGKDSIDGRYSVKGTWEEVGNGEYEVEWTERYKDFEVEVEGKLKKGNILSGRFTSSRRISGTFVVGRYSE
ncbi:predicted protein [Chaetoceros tenuissimus]|uniref:Uncharacterized protein n=1 Tax=Chaetoceros tenuissimus TaxID=426638 RepID=A0AAD3GYH0_9STRA|nr:predicted protein [Chaetoceros tenuissimus]